MSIWAITCHFNPAGFRSRDFNFDVFSKDLARKGIPLLAVELGYDGKPSRTERTIRLVSKSVLWQKERLLNYTISQLPADCDKIAWVDADILFEDGTFELLDKALDVCEVVQPFREVKRLFPGQTEWTDLNPWGGALWPERGVIHSFEIGEAGNNAAYGFAWAARRDYLERIGGLYERAILGGGDSFFVRALLGLEPYCISPLIDVDTHAYHDRVASTHPRVCSIPTSIRHLYHGSLNNRRYFDRHEILVKHSFDPQEDIRVENNVLEWNCLKPGFAEDVMRYFSGRREDDLE